MLHSITQRGPVVAVSAEGMAKPGGDPRGAVARSGKTFILPDTALLPGNGTPDESERDELVALRPLIENFDVLERQKLSTLRRLYRFYRGTGYWELASRCITQVHATTGRDTDMQALDKIRREIEADLGADPFGRALDHRGGLLGEWRRRAGPASNS